jgi:hypothetical protein
MYLITGVHGAVSRTARPIDPPGQKHSKPSRGRRANDPLGLRWQHMSINVDLDDSITSIVSGSSLKEYSKIYVGEPRVLPSMTVLRRTAARVLYHEGLGIQP